MAIFGRLALTCFDTGCLCFVATLKNYKNENNSYKVNDIIQPFKKRIFTQLNIQWQCWTVFSAEKPDLATFYDMFSSVITNLRSCTYRHSKIQNQISLQTRYMDTVHTWAWQGATGALPLLESWVILASEVVMDSALLPPPPPMLSSSGSETKTKSRMSSNCVMQIVWLLRYEQRKWSYQVEVQQTDKFTIMTVQIPIK